MWLYHVRYHDMTGIFAIYGHVYYGAHAVAGDVLHAQSLHQLIISRCHLNAVHLGDYTIAADLLYVSDAASVYFLAIRLLEALAYGV